MVIIFSKKDLETTTDKVVDYLYLYDHPFLRINFEDFYEYQREIRISNNKKYDSLNHSVWYRKWGVPLPNLKSKIFKDKNVFHSTYEFLTKEFKHASNLYFNKYSNSNWLSNPENATLDKLHVLAKAEKIGLKIPNSIVTNSKKNLNIFLKNQKNVICKPLSDGIMMQDKDNLYMMYTSKIDNIEVIPSFFPYSLFQQEIIKKIEIRAFFLDNKIYSMAIFSQENEKTKLDFRHYDWNRPNRNTPYKLPEFITDKLIKLFKELNLSTGSVDLIYSSNDQYYFLEINPVGQFGMISYPCNYYLEEKVANYLISHDEETKKNRG
ncbi:MAG: grasp-with-spasm system ATP-grasp peptide maturase [Flavobacteriia bacterium]|nr:grasp-with-spasm system ATP-grasp peptide maturase [Flavobacteriia bacterium]